MASEPDDNPFARNSVWPRMPQAPFRVGPLPKSGAPPAADVEADPEAPAEAERPRAITPLFVRPVDEPPPSNLGMGGAVPRAPVQPGASAPAVAPAPIPQAGPVAELRPPEPAPTSVPPPAAAPPQEPVELAELVVTPLRPRPKSARRRSRGPAIAAAVIGVAGLAGLAWLFTRGGASAPTAPAAVVPAVANLPPAAAPATAPAAAPVAPQVTPPAPAPITTAAAAPPPARAAAARPREVRQITLPSDAARATEEALGAPVLALPQPAAQPPAAAPAPPEPSYRPPPPPDPNAPVKTQRPY